MTTFHLKRNIILQFILPKLNKPQTFENKKDSLFELCSKLYLGLTKSYVITLRLSFFKIYRLPCPSPRIWHEFGYF